MGKIVSKDLMAYFRLRNFLNNLRIFLLTEPFYSSVKYKVTNIFVWAIYQASFELQKSSWTFFNRELAGIFQNVQHFNPRWSESGEIEENKVYHVLWDTL